ncbi:aminotransferase class I/II-fold pyridoxal phosphate-dependent enzyme [uncultured Fibrobacter sp.]|uniref:aminotransferase class I/II-fold pyridoxal phosphate-dependent enzyme n=1 Tax=uncultured Fibrobacter sp. TaxID=261512 RepID=UPI002637C724|nr:aminotransferase class I/II-fold pyridoxal phosphate-dependent enzyme [uncultured Fibrobacter sp.]
MIQVWISAAALCATTLLGSVLGFLIKELPHKWNDTVLGYCAGVMLAASTLGLIVPAFEQGGAGQWWIVALGVMAGAAFLNVLDLLTPHLHHITGLDPERHVQGTSLSRVMLFVMAIALHKLPEGIASIGQYALRGCVKQTTVNVPASVASIGKGAFYGYGPEQGYQFLRDKIAKVDFQDRGIDISAEEILVSDGAKCDCGNIQELFAADVKIAVGDPVYPVYVDTNVMAGRGYSLLTCDAANGFVPGPEGCEADVVYLCYPNNPTGAVATLEQLQAWVDWANERKSLILFDAAYEAFIRTPGIPHSIFECKGAKTCVRGLCMHQIPPPLAA